MTMLTSLGKDLYVNLYITGNIEKMKSRKLEELLGYILALFNDFLSIIIIINTLKYIQRRICEIIMKCIL